MRRNSNYFGDLSQFFLRAKKEENFVLDAKIKNELREKISLKINEIKNPVIEKEMEPDIRQDIDDTPSESITEKVLNSLSHGATCLASAYEKYSLVTV